MNKPAEVFSVGAYLSDELQARGWTIDRFVREMGPWRDEEEYETRYLTVELTLAYHGTDCRIGRNVVTLFATALGVSTELVLGLQKQFVESGLACTCEQCTQVLQ